MEGGAATTMPVEVAGIDVLEHIDKTHLDDGDRCRVWPEMSLILFTSSDHLEHHLSKNQLEFAPASPFPLVKSLNNLLKALSYLILELGGKGEIRSLLIQANRY